MSTRARALGAVSNPEPLENMLITGSVGASFVLKNVTRSDVKIVIFHYT